MDQLWELEKILSSFILITLSSNQGKTNKVPEMGVLSSIVIPIASPMLYLIPLCMQNGPNVPAVKREW